MGSRYALATVWVNPYSNVLSSDTDGASFESMRMRKEYMSLTGLGLANINQHRFPLLTHFITICQSPKYNTDYKTIWR